MDVFFEEASEARLFFYLKWFEKTEAPH